MGGDASSFATLGLEPGADRESIERAYRRLIKHHHPDREGGDGVRAAEITRAYRELREERAAHSGLEFNEQAAAEAKNRLRSLWLPFALVLVAASLALLFAAGQAPPVVERSLAGTARSLALGAAGRDAEPMQQPIVVPAIAAGVADALRIARSGDEMALSQVSRTCHVRFREMPSLTLLDRCAAFDDAVVMLQDRDPMRDRGAFGELAVTGRQWSAAKALSSDYIAIDGRLGQIRLNVELQLAGGAAGTR